MPHYEDYKDIQITFQNSYSAQYLIEASQTLYTNSIYYNIFQKYFSHRPVLFKDYCKKKLIMTLFLIENRINKLPNELWELIGEFAIYKDYSINTFPELSLYIYFYEQIIKYDNTSHIYFMIKNFDLLSIQNLNIKNEIKNEYYTNIAFNRQGMGHYITLSYDNEHCKYFFKYDGGSNSFSVEDSYKQYLLFKTNKNYENSLLTFKQAYEIIIETDNDKSDLNIHNYILNNRLKNNSHKLLK
jgi:hypothetical protein